MDFFIWDMDPVLLDFGFIQIRWYGLLFALAFFSGFNIVKKIYIDEGKNLDDLDPVFIHMVLGTIIGARLGHCLFYDPSYYLSNPLKIIAVWEGGLASHGGGIGILLSLYIFCKKRNQSLIELLDRLAVPTALAGVFIRTANFFNSEIIGNTTQVPWAVIFKRVSHLPRHPVQLYEAFSYLLIFILLSFLYKKQSNKKGVMLGLFLILIFTARFFLEFFKIPQAAYYSGNILNTGQLLSIPFVVTGLFFVIYGVKKK